MVQPAHRRLVTEAALDTRLVGLDYRSGPRNITSLFSEVESGKIILSRVATLVLIEFDEVKVSNASGAFTTLSYQLPTGFQSSTGRYQWDDLMTSSPVSGTPRRIRVDWTGRVIIYGLTTSDTVTGRIPYLTTNPLPATPPGAPA